MDRTLQAWLSAQLHEGRPIEPELPLLSLYLQNTFVPLVTCLQQGLLGYAEQHPPCSCISSLVQVALVTAFVRGLGGENLPGGSIRRSILIFAR